MILARSLLSSRAEYQLRLQAGDPSSIPGLDAVWPLYRLRHVMKQFYEVSYYYAVRMIIN